MNKNIIILVFLGLMIAAGVYSWSLFKEVEHQKKEVAIREEKLTADSVKNVLIQRERDSLINKLIETSLANNEVAQNDTAVQKLVQNIKKVSDASAKLNDLPSYQASQLEKEGFEALANNQFDLALAKFTQAEKILPSFHMAYEISELLKKERTNLNDPEKQKDLKRVIIDKYSWRAPAKPIKQLKEQVKLIH
jgi:hypothetical protein